MNKYGAMLLRQYKQADPERFAQIPDPESFFSRRGLELEQEIESLAQALAGADRPGETYLQKTTRLATARTNAESDLIAEAMTPDPEDVEAPLRPQWRSLAHEDPGG